MMLKVTEVHIHFIPQNQGLFALARVVLNDSLVIGGVGIHKKRHGDGLRLTYPNRRLNNGQNVTIVHPIKPELSKAIEKAVFQKVEATLKDVGSDDRYHQTDY